MVDKLREFGIKILAYLLKKSKADIELHKLVLELGADVKAFEAKPNPTTEEIYQTLLLWATKIKSAATLAE